MALSMERCNVRARNPARSGVAQRGPPPEPRLRCAAERAARFLDSGCFICIHVIPIQEPAGEFPKSWCGGGLHAPKFATEDWREHSSDLLRYELPYPVVVDEGLQMGRPTQRAWPTTVLIDPGLRLRHALRRGCLRCPCGPLAGTYHAIAPRVCSTPRPGPPWCAWAVPETPLSFPGKILVDAQRPALHRDQHSPSHRGHRMEGRVSAVIGSARQAGRRRLRPGQFARPRAGPGRPHLAGGRYGEPRPARGRSRRSPGPHPGRRRPPELQPHSGGGGHSFEFALGSVARGEGAVYRHGRPAPTMGAGPG